MIPLPGLSIIGEGRYLHLAELCEASIAATATGAPLRIALHRPTDRAVALWPRARQGGDIGVFEPRRAAGWSFAIALASDRALDRIADPDPPDFTRAAIGDTTAELAVANPASALRHAVQLSAALLSRTTPGWRFRAAEAALDRLPTAGVIGLKLETRVAGRLWKIGLAQDGDRIGHLLIAKGGPKNDSPD